MDAKRLVELANAPQWRDVMEAIRPGFERVEVTDGTLWLIWDLSPHDGGLFVYRVADLTARMLIEAETLHGLDHRRSVDDKLSLYRAYAVAHPDRLEACNLALVAIHAGETKAEKPKPAPLLAWSVTRAKMIEAQPDSDQRNRKGDHDAQA